MNKEKPEVEKRWGWLGHLVASLIIMFFRVLESVLKAVFALLSALA